MRSPRSARDLVQGAGVAGKFPIALVALMALAACNRQPPPAPLDHGWAPPGACIFVGNRPDRHYCKTTGTQILANPAVYDGHLVNVTGWIAIPPDKNTVVMFLTRDALDGAAPEGSVNLSGPAMPVLARFATMGNPTLAPVQARVCGRFRLYGLAPDGSRAQQGFNKSFRFGAIEELECAGP